MKTPFFLLLLVTFLSSDAGAQDGTINQLIHKKQMLKVQDVLNSSPGIPEEAKIIYGAVLLNAFGAADSSSKLLQQVEKPASIKDDTLRHFYFSTAYDNEVKLFQYKKAATTGDYLLKHFSSFYTPAELSDEKQALIIWNAFKDVPPQTISQPDTTSIPLKKDIAGLWNLPVSVGDSTYDFVYDSGAGLSTITESFAKLLGVTIIDKVTVPIKGGVTGIETLSRLGIASQLKIKDMLIRNCVFLVFPDSALSFANGAYKIRGIIGFPVIKEMGTLHFTADQLLAIKNGTQTEAHKNMIIDQLKPVVYLQYKSDLLPFTFDSGAGTSIFSDVFYKRYKEELDKAGKAIAQTVTGTSGPATLAILQMPELELLCLNQKIVLKDVDVSKERISTNSDVYYGNLGQDVIKQFKKMVINFKDCYIRFEND